MFSALPGILFFADLGKKSKIQLHRGRIGGKKRPKNGDFALFLVIMLNKTAKNTEIFYEKYGKNLSKQLMRKNFCSIIYGLDVR